MAVLLEPSDEFAPDSGLLCDCDLSRLLYGFGGSRDGTVLISARLCPGSHRGEVTPDLETQSRCVGRVQDAYL